MKKTIALFLLLSSFAFCQEKKMLKGEIFFITLDKEAYFKFPDKAISQMEKFIDSLSNDKNFLDKESKSFLRIEKINKLKLFRVPCIRIKSNTSFYADIIFLKNNQYDKVKQFDYEDLKKRNRKVLIELSYIDYGNKVFISDEIINVSEVEGIPSWQGTD